MGQSRYGDQGALQTLGTYEASLDENQLLIQQRYLIWGVSLASVIVYINLYLMQGMLLSLSDHFHVTASQASLVLSVTSFSLALSLLGYAVLSDRIGRHKPIMISLWLIAMTNLALVFVGSFEALLVIRLLQGVLLAAVPACAMAYFRDLLSTQNLLKAGAFYIAANSLGGIGGRLIGGLMAQYLDWPSAMTVLSLLTLALVSAVQLLLPKTESNIEFVPLAHPAIKLDKPILKYSVRLTTWGTRIANSLALSRGDIKGFIYHLSRRQMRLAYLCGGLAFMMMVNQFSFVQLHLIEQFHWGRFEATLIFLCYLSGTLASYYSAPWISRFGHRVLYPKALFLMLIGSIVTLNDTPFFIFIGFIITASGFFLMHACCNTWVAMGANQHRAKASALYLCSYYLGASIGGPYLMMFWQWNAWPGVVVGSMGILALLALAVAQLAKQE